MTDILDKSRKNLRLYKYFTNKQMKTRSSNNGAQNTNDEIRLSETNESHYQIEISYVSQFIDLD